MSKGTFNGSLHPTFTMQDYVLGFAFDTHGEHLVLIRKARPIWQAGRLNGVGGKVEPGESNILAMVREFREETGVATQDSQWAPLGVLQGDHFRVWLYSARLPVASVMAVQSMTDEPVERVWFNDIERWGAQALENVPLLARAAHTVTPGLFLTWGYDSKASFAAFEAMVRASYPGEDQ